MADPVLAGHESQPPRTTSEDAVPDTGPREPAESKFGRPALALGLFALCLALGLFWLLFNPPTYRASIGVQIAEAPVTRLALVGEETLMRTLIERIASEPVLEAAIDLMWNMPSLTGHPALSGRSSAGRRVRGGAADTGLIAALRSRLRLVAELPSSGRFRLAYHDRDPLFAIGVMLALADVYQGRSAIVDGGRLRVVDQPRLDPEPIGPDPLRVALQSLLAGTIAALLVAFSAIFPRRPKVNSVADVAGIASMRVLQVPEQATRPRGFRWQPRPRTGHGPGLLSLRANDGPAIAALRRMALDVAARISRGEIRTLFVTSSQYGCGKSFVVGNLAVMLGQAGVRVLVVEADWREPRMPDLFDLVSFHGLADVLEGRAGIEAAIRRTRVERVDLMLPGRRPADGEPVISRERCAALLAGLSQAYSLILIDCAPAFVTRHAEAIAAVADATMVVAREQRTSQRELRRLIERLGNAGARIDAIVLNQTGGDRQRRMIVDDEADVPAARRSA